MTGKIPPKVLCRFNEVTINIYGCIFVEEFIIKYMKVKSSKKSQNILDEEKDGKTLSLSYQDLL